MSATSPTTLPRHHPAPSPVARLALKADGTSRGLLDGAETGAEAAARLTAAASDADGPTLTASALVTADEARHDARATDEPLDPDEAWEYEGGASTVSAADPEEPGPPARTGQLTTGK